MQTTQQHRVEEPMVVDGGIDIPIFGHDMGPDFIDITDKLDPMRAKGLLDPDDDVREYLFCLTGSRIYGCEINEATPIEFKDMVRVGENTDAKTLIQVSFDDCNKPMQVVAYVNPGPTYTQHELSVTGMSFLMNMNRTLIVHGYVILGVQDNKTSRLAIDGVIRGFSYNDFVRIYSYARTCTPICTVDLECHRGDDRYTGQVMPIEPPGGWDHYTFDDIVSIPMRAPWFDVPATQPTIMSNPTLVAASAPPPPPPPPPPPKARAVLWDHLVKSKMQQRDRSPVPYIGVRLDDLSELDIEKSTQPTLPDPLPSLKPQFSESNPSIVMIKEDTTTSVVTTKPKSSSPPSYVVIDPSPQPPPPPSREVTKPSHPPQVVTKSPSPSREVTKPSLPPPTVTKSPSPSREVTKPSLPPPTVTKSPSPSRGITKPSSPPQVVTKPPSPSRGVAKPALKVVVKVPIVSTSPTTPPPQSSQPANLGAWGSRVRSPIQSPKTSSITIPKIVTKPSATGSPKPMNKSITLMEIIEVLRTGGTVRIPTPPRVPQVSDIIDGPIETIRIPAFLSNVHPKVMARITKKKMTN